MKRLLGIVLVFLSLGAIGQTYNPALATVSNKPYGQAQGWPTDARSYYYDATNYLWRPYQSTAEVLSYLNLSKYRAGQFPIYVNVGGALNGDGSFTGGTIYTYWFRNGTADGDLELLSINPGYGVKITASTVSVDTSTLRKVDSLYATNDSTLRMRINGATYDITLPGNPAASSVVVGGGLFKTTVSGRDSIYMDESGVIAGPYRLMSAQVDSKGRVTKATSGTVVNQGQGEGLGWLYTYSTPSTNYPAATIYLKKLYDTTYISWHTKGDSSLYALLDTAAIRAALGGDTAVVAGYGIKINSGVASIDTFNYRKVDSLYTIDDTTVRFVLNGKPYDINVNGKQVAQTAYVGGYAINITGAVVSFDSTNYRKVDTLYSVNDSTIRYFINGRQYDFTLRGASNGVTNLGYTASSTDGTVTSSTGTSATIPAADGTNAGLLKPADYNLLQDSVITNVSKTDSIVVYRTKGGTEVFRDTARTSHGIGTIVDSVVYTASGSIDTLTFSKLVDKTALSVEVHPYVLHLTSTTPGTDEVQVNATTGGVKFGTALTSGQTVTILYKYTVTDGTAAVTTVNSQTGDVVIDGSETKVAAGANITVTGTGTTADPYMVSVTGGTITSSSATSLSLSTYETYVYTGASSATWTLPSIGTTGRKYYVKNRGSGNLTLQTTGPDLLFTNTTTSSIIVLTGDSYLIQDDGTYWIVL